MKLFGGVKAPKRPRRKLDDRWAERAPSFGGTARLHTLPTNAGAALGALAHVLASARRLGESPARSLM